MKIVPYIHCTINTYIIPYESKSFKSEFQFWKNLAKRAFNVSEIPDQYITKSKEGNIFRAKINNPNLPLERKDPPI